MHFLDRGEESLAVVGLLYSMGMHIMALCEFAFVKCIWIPGHKRRQYIESC